MSVQRRDADFRSNGTRCAAWLYEPAAENPPVVVMAHGFGGEREARLPAFAERFAAAGMAVLVFDYRTFGDSEGTPRHVVSGRRHVEDYRAALDHVRSLDGVDGDRVGLWGTSFSGGHVVEVAAEADVEAVVSQVPFTDGRRTALHLVRQGGLSYVAGVQRALTRNALRRATLRGPAYVPIVADPDEFGVLNTPDAKPGYLSLVPEGEDWDNECAARILATVGTYRPVTAAADVDCPVYVAQATEDSIIPADSVDALVRELDHVERDRYPVGHFEPYTGECFEEVVSAERAFFERHLDA
ncbi:alpha/beta hydrolase [Halorientalis litorea]|uniref:alpha/beta hydrolase n=1 Tax=Halorientalis litorea TaxID=2931977 RepID=UPI001FF38F08|nr:alpha/beta hydrolase [Halorientalis litorea]